MIKKYFIRDMVSGVAVGYEESGDGHYFREWYSFNTTSVCTELEEITDDSINACNWKYRMDSYGGSTVTGQW